MAFCAKCGSPLEENTRFCPKCGAEVIAAASEAAEAASAAADSAASEAAGAAENATEQAAGAAGAAAGGAAAGFQGAADNVKQVFNTPDSTSQFDPDDIQKNKGISILAYFGILFLIPLFAAPQSKFARFHSNQGLVLCIFAAGYGILTGIITGILGSIAAATYSLAMIGVSSVVTILLSLVGIVFLVFAILGIINAATGKAKELPLIGKIKILK